MIRRLLFLLPLLLLGAAEPPPKPVVLSPEEAEKQGRALAAELLMMGPGQASTNTGVMSIRAKSKRSALPVRFKVLVTATNWVAIYQAVDTNGGFANFLCVERNGDAPNRYSNVKLALSTISPDPFLSNDSCSFAGLTQEQVMAPFADSDFWLADFGLEFFRWPQQRLVRREMNRSRSCRVLESVNPRPVPGGYSRVLTWIDNESSGIVQADAFDAKGRLLKQFFPKRFKKVEGQYQLAEMQINNVQTQSRTTIEFSFE